MVDGVSESNSIGVEVKHISVVVVFDVDLQDQTRIPCTFTARADGCVETLDVAKRVQIAVRTQRMPKVTCKLLDLVICVHC